MKRELGAIALGVMAGLGISIIVILLIVSGSQTAQFVGGVIIGYTYGTIGIRAARAVLA